MQRKVKIIVNKRGQAVPLPKEFRFAAREVYIRKVGDEVILSPRPVDWSTYLDSAPVASAKFMAGIEDLPVQVRKL